MRTVLDLLAAVILLLASPWWIIQMARHGTLRTDWAARFGRGPSLPPKRRPRVLVHAVSVGEVAAAWPLIEELRRRGAPATEAATETGTEPDDAEGTPAPLDVVVSVTTDTGMARAGQLNDGRCSIVRTPYAFHWSIRRWLRRCDPDVLVLMELEVWPSMVAQASDHGIPVIVVNGRLTERSLRRYLAIRPLVAPSFGRLAACAVQDEATAARFAAVGTPRDRITVTGTMKWDRATIVDEVPGADELAEAMGIDRTRPLVVAGSTSPDETALIDRAVGDAAQLLIAPRRPEWFDGVAEELAGCTRRSRLRPGEAELAEGTEDPVASASPPATDVNGTTRGGHADAVPGAGSPETTPGGGPRGRFLLDTIGELRPAYCLADVVIVGRSFGSLHGSDMMEPVGLGKPVVVGPRTGDFAAVMDDLLDGRGVLQVQPEDLPTVIATLLEDPDERRALADRGRAVIRRRQGAATRNAAIVRAWLSGATPSDGDTVATRDERRTTSEAGAGAGTPAASPEPEPEPEPGPGSVTGAGAGAGAGTGARAAAGAVVETGTRPVAGPETGPGDRPDEPLGAGP